MNVSYQLNSTTKTNPKSQITSQTSVTFLMGMLLCGLTGETLEEMCTAFNISLEEKDKLVNTMISLYHELNNSNTVKVHNLILSRIGLKKDFIEKVKLFGDHESIHSSVSTSELTHKVNSLVSHHTKGMITKIVEQKEVEGLAIILLNTIYFYSEWATKFELCNTRKEKFFEFTNLGGERHESLMQLHAKRFKYFESDKYQLLQMPYTNPHFSFVVVLPKSEQSAELIEQSAESTQPSHICLSDIELFTSLESATMEKVNVVLPKFTQETEIDLIPVLKNIGVNKLFVDADADNMLESANPAFLSILKQKAKIIVDENGTEASAVTMGGMRCTAMRPDMSKVYDFTANHPFEYYIVYSGSDHNSNMVLFEGSYV